MKIRSLRSVGEAVPDFKLGHSIESAWPCATTFSRYWYNTGTAALAAACQSAIASMPIARPSGRPEIIVPAYTCPDVVSAVIHAGAKPVLIDFVDAGSPQFDVDRLEHSLNARTAAVIAVNFLGIPQDLARIRQAIAGRPVQVIYDHCQGLMDLEDPESLADYLVFSFGRGKPASALGGGALVVNRSRIDDTIQVPGESYSIGGRSKAHVYNALIRPSLFGIASRLPGLNIGQTIYRPLDSILALDERSVARIAASIAAYKAHKKQHAEVVRKYQQAMTEVVLGSSDSLLSASYRMLRFPIVVSSKALRDELLVSLIEEGLGASRMYPGLLFEVQGVPLQGFVRQGFPNASAFCDRLLTLPIHSDVTSNDIDVMAQLIKRVF